jgi:DNA-binding NtrC family response regulator
MLPRSRLPDLTRLLDAVDDPICVVDAGRRLVFVNAACAAWLGQTVADLVGRVVHYGTTTDDSPSAAAAALCPPPISFAGRRVVGEVVPPSGPPRRAEFIPLGVGAEGAALVVVWLPSVETSSMLAAEHHRCEDESHRLHALTAQLRRDAAARYAPGRLIGVSPALERVRRQLAVAAQTAASVAIVGPSGVGKTHVARTIHTLRVAAAAGTAIGPLVPLDGPTLNAELLQAAIRTLARGARDEHRRGGDLVIQNIDRMPLDARTELGGFLKLVELPTRLIVTTAEPLAKLAAAGKFPPDLAARLSTLEIELPPLAARPEDVPVLAQHFLEEANAGPDRRQLGGFTPDALDRLAAYAWPGNVAELAEVVSAACAKAVGPLVVPADLPKRLDYAADAVRFAPQPEPPVVLDDVLAEVETELLQRALRRAKGNKTKAAQLLGITRPRLLRRLIQLGLEQGPVIFEEADADPAIDDATAE